MRSQIFFLLLVATVLFSCGPTYRPFTDSLQRSYNWSEDDLKKVQFYLSEDIVLTRNLRRGESVIDGGKIRVRQGRRVEEIIIPSGTPGVLSFMPKHNRLAISFENGKDRFLMFGPNPKHDGRYVLLGSSWNRNSGEITYQGKKYRTSSRSAFAGLLVDLESMNKVSVRRRKVDGKKI